MSDSELSEFNSLWELYGLKTNPFSTSPLLVKGGLIPIESFSGRKEELARLLKIFRSDGGSRTLVCGDVGVGKTSLVNVARFQANNGGFFTPFKEIGVQEDWDSDKFIVNTLYAIYATIKLISERPIQNETYEKLKNLVELNNIETKTGIGLNVGIVGANLTQNSKSPSITSNIALFDFFQEVVKEIKKKTGKDIIIHYNNLELLKEKSIRRIFEDLRDFFQTDFVHFVFVGNLTVHSIFQSMPRFSSIINDTPILLNELTFEEIDLIITTRLEKLQILHLKYVTPFTKDALRVLFDLYSGNIRNILNSLQTAVVEATKERAVKLDKNSIAIILKEIVKKRYLGELQPKPKELLMEAVKYNEITNKRLSELTQIQRSNVSTYTKLLESRGCIYVRRKDGKDKYWSVEPKIKWLLLKEEDRQQSLERFM